MKVRRKREEAFEDVKRVVISIGEVRYNLSESVDGKLVVNKISDGDTDYLMVFPRYANEIELL